MWGINRLKRRIKSHFYNSSFHNLITKTSEDLYVFGNGYSIANLDLTCFKNQDCFVCNDFCRFNHFDEFAANNNISYFGMDGMGSFYDISRREHLTLSDALKKYIDPWTRDRDYNIIVPPSMTKYIISINPSAKIGVFADDITKILRKRVKGVNLDSQLVKRASTIRHTPQAMIVTGIILGYKNIHLYGVDHSYVRDILNKNPMAGKHFYLETAEEVCIGNCIDKDKIDYSINLSDLFLDNFLTFKTYESQQIIAQALGIKIQDKTDGSLFCFQDFNLTILIEKDSKRNQNN